MIIVTGGAGFIGSNLVHTLNQQGETNILVVDSLANGHKMHNLADLDIADYIDKQAFIDRLGSSGFLPGVRALFHQGACSTTTEWNGQYVMYNNYDYSKRLLHWCANLRVPFLYASSASVYGIGQHGFQVGRPHERPINMYAYSKFQFDQYVRRVSASITSQVVGLRYFNVYGPREQHKGAMSSTIFHFNRQLLADGCVRLFEGCDGYADGEQQRDFVHVQDVVDVNVWFWQHPQHSGIYNVGTGKAETFNTVAKAVLAWHGQGHVEYIPFPDHLRGSYQSYTCADISPLRTLGYDKSFFDVQGGVTHYLDCLNKNR
jgi:ADP-L-glycero-D-manno-heptose 6-epimerase